MASPLSYTSCSRTNIQSIQSTIQRSYESTFYGASQQEDTFYDVEEYVPSSPLMAEQEPSQTGQYSPSKSRSPQKLDMEHRSPVKALSHLRSAHLQAIEYTSATEDKENHPGGDVPSLQSSRGFDPDDTCASAFSMVPTADMTRFAKLSESPSKAMPYQRASNDSPATPTRRHANDTVTPSSRTRTPGLTTKSLGEASPAPRRQRAEDMTTELLEFTEQLTFQGLRNSPKKTPVVPTTQARNIANLLDFDLPPAPTPRSMPSISAREVESMKASFQSQISSLKATIDGKEATIQSLIDTKNEAERQVGEVSESLRDVSDAKKMLLEEKEDWERRDNEVRTILRDVKSELVHREKERDDLSMRLEESEKKREETETRLHAAEAKIAGHESETQPSHQTNEASPEGSKTPNKAVEVAVEKVARELHQLYKQKHETKVNALKKSYEGRWERKVRDLDAQVVALTKENEDLRNGREATMTKVMPGLMPNVETADAATSPRNNYHSSSDSTVSQEALVGSGNRSAASTEKIQTLNLKVASLEEEIKRSKEETLRLQDDLDTSRAENSDLVAVVEEMLQMDPNASIVQPSNESSTAHETRSNDTSAHIRVSSQSDQEHAGANPQPSRNGAVVAPKTSGLARPGFGFGGASRGMGRPTSGGARSGIMSSIEKMGRGRAGESQ